MFLSLFWKLRSLRTWIWTWMWNRTSLSNIAFSVKKILLIFCKLYIYGHKQQQQQQQSLFLSLQHVLIFCKLAISEFQKLLLLKEAKCKTFLAKMNFICMRIKNHSISKAEHWTSFWYRGPGKLGNGLIDYFTVKNLVS